VTINTDNRLVTDTTMTDELWRAIEVADFNGGELRQLLINGFKSAFMPFHERQAMLRKVSRELDEAFAAEADRQRKAKIQVAS
jgi:adenosine deaminase